MNRKFQQFDMNQVIDIWLEASINAHGFIKAEFWESKVNDMREIYIPSGETHVYDKDWIIKGFVSLLKDTLTALFVSPNYQGTGIGKQLMAKSKEVRGNLNLTVYN